MLHEKISLKPVRIISIIKVSYHQTAEADIVKAIKIFYFDSLPPVVKNSEGHGWINVEPAVISGQQAPENETLHFVISERLY